VRVCVCVRETRRSARRNDAVSNGTGARAHDRTFWSSDAIRWQILVANVPRSMRATNRTCAGMRATKDRKQAAQYYEQKAHAHVRVPASRRIVPTSRHSLAAWPTSAPMKAQLVEWRPSEETAEASDRDGDAT
jgi:hypothetical protein